MKSNKLKIGIYIKNQRIRDVDCTRIETGNPGIGGTFFAMISLSYFITKNFGNKIDFFVYAESIDLLPGILTKREVRDLVDLKQCLVSDGIDYLIIGRIKASDVNTDFFTMLEQTEVKVIVWAHCFLPVRELSFLYRNEKVSRIVCVGREQLDSYLDHPAFIKSTVINNGITFYEELMYKRLPFNKRKNNVVYIGSIIEEKGFHILAKAWKRIISKVPDAELHIVGSGQLYDRNRKLGKYGIAEEKYEKKFIKYLIDKDGNLLPSVFFHGILGIEKFILLSQSKVGVPNPSGKSETFGYTAIEMQIAGSLIAAKECHGYLDTVYNKAGIFFKNNKHLSEVVIRLLETEFYDFSLTEKFITDNFNYDKISSDWYELFMNLNESRKKQYDNYNNLEFNKKKIRLYNKKLRKIRLLYYLLPPILFYENIYQQIIIYSKKIINKLSIK